MAHAVTLKTLQQLKANGEKFTCVTGYDATFTQWLCGAGVDTILVGDSLGMVLQGHDSTLPVTVDEMAYHTACVSRSNNRHSRPALIIADMPFMSYATVESALANAARLMQAGAHVVKLEGGQWLAETIYQLTERGIPVCCHLGLTPQSVNRFGGFLVQGKSPERAAEIKQDALSIEQAGANLLVLECIPAPVAADICTALQLLTIGIGAGAATDAQVLVLHDLLGLNTNPPRFVKNFMQGQDSIQAALQAYVREVKAGTFPAAEHCFK